MPFTFSHPAIVLPFSYLPKRWVSLTALVIGSMTPDFEYFIRMKVAARYGHTWPGLFYFDLPLAFLLMLIYNRLVKNKLIDHLPSWFNKHLSEFKNSNETYLKPHFIVIVICILIGAASHIFWDGFTHPAGYFVLHHRILRHKVMAGHYAVERFHILQHVSTFIGAAVILYAINQLPVGKLTRPENIIYYWLKIAAIALLVLLIRLLTGLNLKEYGDVIVTGISGGLIGLVFVSVITPTKLIAQN
ncbi:MAG TPA: DUF4184 family protein [Mucilaginibacter sp.]|nr:DUF4184 family protein [Mucilaginibacter sp.]